MRWPPRSRGIASRFVYGEIERPAPYLRNGLWLSVVRRALLGSPQRGGLPGFPPFRPCSDKGAGSFQVVDAERDVGMATHGAEMNHADDIDPGIAEFPGEGGEGSGLVVEAHDEHGSHGAGVAAFHHRLPRLHRLVHDQAHIRSSARGFAADRVDVDPRLSQDRGELREFPGSIGEVHVNLDHVPLPRDIAVRGYKHCAPSFGGESLMRCGWVGPSVSCATNSRTSGFRCETWTVRSRSIGTLLECRSSAVSMFRKQRVNGQSFAVLDRNSCSN